MRPEIIDHPADIGIRVYGKTLEHALEKSALALYYLLLEHAPIDTEKEIHFEIKGDDIYSVTYDILEEVLVLFETEGYIAGDAKFHIIEENGSFILSACLKGAYYKDDTLIRKYDVKAITYHQMKIEKLDNRWMIQVIVDI